LPPGGFRRRIPGRDPRLEGRRREAGRLEVGKAGRLGGPEMTRPAIVATVITSAILTVSGVRVLEARRADPSVKALVAATQAYVADFESQLAYGVFDEDYTQSVDADSGAQQRTMHGELFLTFLPADQEWIAVHDVAVVDGQPVADRESLQALLQRGPLESVRHDVIARNARYNIGSVARNFNEPTLALLVLERVRASTFDFFIDRIFDDGTGVRLAVLRFNEKRDKPATFIQGPQGQATQSKGDFIVEVRTGRIRQTHFTLDLSATSVTLTTYFVREPGSGLWLPSLFQEYYERLKDGPHEVISCEAKYTNFRRFEVLGRIK
jgi:hypothetical protein